MVPLVIFTYNRPDHLRKVIDAVRAQTIRPPLIVAYVDGPKYNTDERLVVACKRDLRHRLADYTKLEIVERSRNYGCPLNIMSGTSEVCAGYDGFAVLEDDTLPASRWYEAICLLLSYYHDDQRVGAVGGYPSLLNGAIPGYAYDTIASPRFSSWGWGAWSDKWRDVCAEWDIYRAGGPLRFDPRLLPATAGNDIGNMIADAPRGSLWDGFVAGSFLNRGWAHALTRHYLINNIGADSHLHGSKLQFMMNNNPMDDRMPALLPPESGLDAGVCAAVQAYVRAMS